MKALLLLALLSLAACGQSGDLYLPDQSGDTPEETQTDGSF